MPFYIDHDDTFKEVISAKSYLSSHFGGYMNINWSIKNFGFGQYSLSKKNEIISISNECNSKEIVTSVVKQAFDEMFYHENYSIQSVSENFNYQQTAKYFSRDPKYCMVWMQPHESSEDENHVYQSYFLSNDYEEIKIVFKKSSFPSENADNFTISRILQHEDWSDMFVSASKVDWKITSINENTQEISIDESCDFVDMLWIEDKKEMHFLWKNNLESGFIIVKNHSYLPLVEITNFGKRKRFIFNLINSMMNQAKLEDD